ncbi:MAG TPA: LssY C-terminal domain-containing protein [Candidatus Peribacteraceae bacterium]|nr:LssY C-terminal domain-containing protein [Candidatus Peribacteraceae bacterium]
MDALVHSLTDLQHMGPLVYIVILLLAFLESLVITGMFVPGTVVIVIAGGLAAHGYYSYWLLVLFATIGAIVGDSLSFELGRKGQMRLQKRAILRKHIERAKPYFKRHQRKSIVIGRFFGPIRPVIPFLAGVADMKRPQFYAIEMVSGISWSIFYVGLGYVFGTAWKLALLWSSRLLLFAIIAFILFTAVAWFWRWMIDWGKTYAVIAAGHVRAWWRYFASLPAVSAWMNRHPRVVSFIGNRFEKAAFGGLPLTCLTVAVLLCLGFFAAIAQDYVAKDPIIALDARVDHLLFTFRTSALLSFFYTITEFGDWRIVYIAALVLTLVLLLQKNRSYAGALWTGLLTGSLITFAAKQYFQRPRPGGLLPALHESAYSFPSMHATVSVIFYGFLAYLFLRNDAQWKGKVSDVFAAVIMVLLIDFSRLYLGVHYFSDVLAGNVVGLAALLFSISVCEWLLWRSAQRTGSLLNRWSASAVACAECLCVAWMIAAVPIHWKTGTSASDMRYVTQKNLLSLFSDGSLPRFTESLFGMRQEPVSFVIIGSVRCMLQAFDRAHWRRADQLSFDSTLKLAKATFLDQEFQAPPISFSFYNSYPQDFGFEKQSKTGGEDSAHHARIWQTSYKTEAGNVFVAAVTLDTRTKWTPLHSIKPDIDYERQLLLNDLLGTHMVALYRTVPFIDPLHTRTFFTNGKAEVVRLSGCAGGN